MRVNQFDAEDGGTRKKLGLDAVAEDSIAFDNELLEPFDGPRFLGFVLLTKGYESRRFGFRVEGRTGNGASGLEVAQQDGDGRMNPCPDGRVRSPP